MKTQFLKKLAKLIRYFILISTSASGSGHPTSSLSATDLMVTLLFGGFLKYDLSSPNYPLNDRLIFSKGHAAPLFYALYTAAGVVSEDELLTLRKFGSRLEGHPSINFPYTEVPTGSLGQGLSAGLGMALNSKYLDKTNYKTFVLLGDSEMAEGSVWEAIQLSAFYKLDNLIAILDVNRLGQSRETMYGHDLKAYQKRISAFGWATILVDGHNLQKIAESYKKALRVKGKPVAIIAKTIKGKGVSFLENKQKWHGKALSEEELDKALKELGEIDTKIRGKITKPKALRSNEKKISKASQPLETKYSKGEEIATRKAYGEVLVKILPQFPNMVVMDGETGNSTYSETFAKAYPSHYFEMFIAEQNMVGAALGLARMGKIPFISTFSAFFTRAFDQIRMAQYAKSNIKFVGSHGGVAIGEDGPSQMGLEDISLFRSLIGSVVLYPSDAVSTEKLVEGAVRHKGLVYIRTTRNPSPVIYDSKEQFPIGGSKTLRQSNQDAVTVIGVGVTLHEALKAYEALKKDKIFIRVIDLYSIKPLDILNLQKAAKETRAIITVEDHHPEGGIGEAVASAVSLLTKVYQLAVKKMPTSGTSRELLDYEEISKDAVIKKCLEILKFA